MKELRTSIEIHAPEEKIWKILTNFSAYPEWNPFIRSLTGEVKEGGKFKVVIQPPDSGAMTFKPTCLKFSPAKELIWLGHLGIPGLFDGEHIFELSKTSTGKTLFIQRENFKGILVPLFWKQLNTKTRRGFELMNEKLKELAEKSEA